MRQLVQVGWNSTRCSVHADESHWVGIYQDYDVIEDGNAGFRRFDAGRYLVY